MDQSIISVAMIRDKARDAFKRGAGRDDHGFNWHSSAVISTWQHEWDLCAAEHSRETGNQHLAESCPP